MDILLVVSILALTTVLGLSVFQGKPLKIEIIHKMDVPAAIPIPPTPEEHDDQEARKDVARTLQEIMGVFQDDRIGT